MKVVADIDDCQLVFQSTAFTGVSVLSVFADPLDLTTPID